MAPAIAPSLRVLLWLTLGAFAIGTEGFMIAGLLPALAEDLGVGVPAAGHLVTAFSVAYALGAPLMAVLTAGMERRRLLAMAMGAFAAANLLAAVAPGYWALMASRLLLALSAGAFMPAASGYAATLAGPELRGRALSRVITGMTLAIIAGVPLGVLVGEALGWRATFLGVGVLAGLTLAGILARLPKQPAGATPSLAERAAVAGRAEVLAVLLATLLAMAGAFTFYTYFGVFLAETAALGPHGVALMLLAFGLASAAGTRLGGAAADRFGPGRAAAAGAGLMVAALAGIGLAPLAGPALVLGPLLPATVLWGIAGWGMMTAQQARLVTLAPTLAAVSLSLNSSATYLGSALGAAVGGAVVAAGATAQLGWVGAGFALAALLSVLAGARRVSPPLPAPQA